ncbi:endonuclease NucS [Natranaeroarchaeum sulfidigenes]|uniref:endonuclease NucS n=1 Tax=Natranaeroarchaeum sulfidigenes TaxID=2784880 RepID=UPI002174E628|nr:endonuclease NucS [Natranaeroarchaeum sulfidigenes]
MTAGTDDTGPRIRTNVDPSLREAAEIIDDGFRGDRLVTAFGRCTVDYDGRASSTLGLGDRHVMCKPDGSILVHTDEGQQPVNWQPPGCTHEVSTEGDRVVLESERSTPAERLVVEFERVGQVSTFAVDDATELSLDGTEEDLRNRILDDPELVEQGFTPLATERETAAGAIDIFGEDADGRTVAVELKRKRVGPDAVGQLDRYVDALRRDLHDDADIRGILVSPSVTDRAADLLERNGLEFVSLTPRK